MSRPLSEIEWAVVAERVTCEGDSSREAEDSLLSLHRLWASSQSLTMLPLEGQGVLLQLAQRNAKSNPIWLFYVPGMNVKPLGSCMTPAEPPVVLRTVPLAQMLPLAETGAR
ncbi:hypothetical protein EYF80_028447 [Liparis tanakae]|uniref:Uncharacterized protein n=1 Tax=Liparis tanakae TaxID=230148 RepID=A0A4Z2H748_9TELE|nr:hypothetical protein EYF80_028447 [Liparis tanakae]